MKKKNLTTLNTPSDSNTPGSKIKAARIEANLSIRELAALSGLTPEAISMMENGVHPPSLKSLIKISACLNRPIYYLGCFEALPEKTLGERIKKARLYKGYTKEKLAMNLNVDPKSILNWETNKVRPSSKNLQELKMYLQITE
ncbi:helix-turn-helix transcriptional regulator [Paenibacillus sp. F411]|uniref:helix-turn-helix domain-containing protein n=1 Tax=Paenibacillus sp. F411 TaxID=2820239 RepID=UPI001AAF97EF|nr:helix-turn-helix transcriptional regulator [Paenibacillus sp. F411]MBO2945771.1 helix-turn-helix transcriptional regulator [Paenibacillus sp. F411]